MAHQALYGDDALWQCVDRSLWGAVLFVRRCIGSGGRGHPLVTVRVRRVTFSQGVSPSIECRLSLYRRRRGRIRGPLVALRLVKKVCRWMRQRRWAKSHSVRTWHEVLGHIVFFVLCARGFFSFDVDKRQGRDLDLENRFRVEKFTKVDLTYAFLGHLDMGSSCRCGLITISMFVSYTRSSGQATSSSFVTGK